MSAWIAARCGIAAPKLDAGDAVPTDGAGGVGTDGAGIGMADFGIIAEGGGVGT